MDEFVCPWCGQDLLPVMASMGSWCSYDNVYEAHAEDCEVMRREMGIVEDNNEVPPCTRDGE